MAHKDVKDRHSQTALFAALCRAVAAKDYATEPFASDSMAACFLPPHIRFFIKFGNIRQKFVKKNEVMTPGAYEYVLARTAFFDGLFTDSENNNITQIVLLGAGYDSRAYRFEVVTRLSRIFELDIPTTQQRKKRCLKRAGVDLPSNLKLVPIDFNSADITKVLLDAGYDATKKTLFLWEGVTMYLEPNAVAATLSSINKTACAGSLVAFDYVLHIPRTDRKHYYGVSEFMQTWEKHRKEEPFRFTANEKDMELLLSDLGMSLVSHMNDREIHDAYLSTEMGAVTGQFRFAVASTAQ